MYITTKVEIMETVKLLNEIFPSVLTDIIYDYVLSYRKEWTISLKKDVLRQIKRTRGGRYYTNPNEYNRVKRSVKAIHHNNLLNGIVEPPYIQHQYKLMKVHSEMRLRRFIMPRLMYSQFYIKSYVDWANYRKTHDKLISSSTVKLGFKNIHNRPNIKLCRRCNQIKSIKEFQFIKGTIRTKLSMCTPCIREHKKEIRTPKSKKPTGIYRLPIEIQTEIKQMYATGHTIRKIAEHFESRVDEFPMLKYQSLCRLKRLGQMDN